MTTTSPLADPMIRIYAGKLQSYRDIPWPVLRQYVNEQGVLVTVYKPGYARVT